MPRRALPKGVVIAQVLRFTKARLAFDDGKSSRWDESERENKDIEDSRRFLHLVKSRIETRNGYCRLTGLVAFFSIYVTTILSQQNIRDMFSVESRFYFWQKLYLTDVKWQSDANSILLSNVVESLPTTGQGSVFNSGGPGATGMLASSSDLLSWFSQTLVPTLFQDAVCGDGQCDFDESRGLGRFGW